MDYLSKYFRIFNHRKNIKFHDRKIMLEEIKGNGRKNKKLTAHDYYKNKCKNHNKLKTEKNDRAKDRDEKYIN